MPGPTRFPRNWARSRGTPPAPPKGSSEACGQPAASWEAQAKTRDSDRQRGMRRRPARGSGTRWAGRWRQQSRGVPGETRGRVEVPGSRVEDTGLPEMGAETPGGCDGCVRASPEYPNGLAGRNLQPKAVGVPEGRQVRKGGCGEVPRRFKGSARDLDRRVLGQVRG